MRAGKVDAAGQKGDSVGSIGKLKLPKGVPGSPALPATTWRTSSRLGVDWKLPGGRAAADHHLFPRELPPHGALQEPVYVSCTAAVLRRAVALCVLHSADNPRAGAPTADLPTHHLR